MNTSYESFQELRAEEVEDLLTRPPGWLLRWGGTVVLAALVGVGAGAWWLHYPDVVRASCRLTSTNAPRAVLARSEGKLMRLLVAEGQPVRAGVPLAFLESTARPQDVLRLSAQLARAWPVARQGRLEALGRLELARYSQLGELQMAYQTFEQAHIQLRAYLAGGFAQKKRAMLWQEKADLNALADNLRQQQALQARDLTLAEGDYAVQQRLAEERVIAPLELKREESKLLARKMPLEQTGSALIQNQTQQRSKEKEVLELDRQVAEERDKFLQALNSLQSAVDAWKAKYILTAPVSGRVAVVGVLQENQSVAIGQELFYVAPPATEYFGELRIPQQNAGKVAVGQTVSLRFAGYPYQEYGAVRGLITHISALPYKDSVFLARVALPHGLRTTQKRQLTQKTGMTATADILTNDTRLLEKLFYQLRAGVTR